MALPHLLKYVYNNGTDEVIRRGKKIHAIGYVEMVEHDDLEGSVVFRVKDDVYATFYKVYIQRYRNEKTMSIRCSCPYNIGDICRHETAALVQLQELLDRNMLGQADVKYDQRHTAIKMKQIDLKSIKMMAGNENYSQIEKILRTGKINILSAENETVKAEVIEDGIKYKVLLKKNEERNFDSSCTCVEEDHPLCQHKAALFVRLLDAYGPNYFDTIRNWDSEKNKLLQLYGFSVNDDLTGKFEFTYKDGKPFLRVLDPTIKRVQPVAAPVIPAPQPVQVVAEQAAAEEEEKQSEVLSRPSKRIAIVLNANHPSFPYISFDAVTGETDDEGKMLIGKVEKIDLNKFFETSGYSEEDLSVIQQLRKIQEAEINKYLNRNSPFSGIWDNIVQHEDDELPEETRKLIIEYLFPKLEKMFASDSIIYYLPKRMPFKTNNLVRADISDDRIHPSFHVTMGTKYELHCQVKLDGLKVAANENEWDSPLLFAHKGSFYLWANHEDILLTEPFMKKGKQIINKTDWQQQLQKFILPLSKTHKVEFDSSLVREIKDGSPEPRILLQEKGDFLIFQPVFSYKGYETTYHHKQDTIVMAQDGKIVVVNRNRADELKFINKLESLHSNFIRPEGSGSLALKSADVLKNNWFFLFVDRMQEMNVPVLGFDVLKNFRFNTSKPKTQIHISSSGVDWFDAKVDILFGDQHVTIAEVKRALTNKQQFVQLNDGTLGILPEEWIKKYSLLFNVGEGKINKLRLSKYHLSVINELYEQRDESEIQFELEEKMERLRSFKNIKEVDPPKELEHILRPYQLSGYHWLNFLNEAGWGGILADDMGLGKTVQALSYMLHYCREHEGMNALVVCPTTLMYNWENEIKKFTSDLSYYIHHGGTRTRNKKIFEEKNIIITTYGTLRSDIKLFTETSFDFVILDESQSIKNPQSKVTKAACLLKAKNRLCLSGTPLQNNTFDLYSQMNFLNPGMLGSVEFFRNEFSTPIDKFGEKDKKDHLRKLLYPFILRRTKEQVAKDLPEKTETILFCEMEEEQQRIYDAYRNDYRSKILGAIDEQGIDKSQLTILQGLMKLRQICDSPAILNEPEKYENHSIKLDELAREITENIGDHKALVFSQFLGMLALIKQKLIELEIPFEYFDGSTTAPERERAIQRFQNDDSCRVFLISLKAGGVGLNLTAADYVYIVDPWWNPAVEQQAIDRTHRIGQTKNIFAYRMICKDTIEDKILQLQDRKRALAKDLVSDDATFVKSLTREDVEYLFS
jgi:non-specific serine/threonine protein kinase